MSSPTLHHAEARSAAERAEPVTPGHWRVAVDIGGTFTDIAAVDERSGDFVHRKVPTTPVSLVDGVLRALRLARIDVSTLPEMVHGSTVAINALIERTGARAALVTSAGMRDIYEIGRANRPDSFNLRFQKHTPLIPRNNIVQAQERVTASGEVVIELSDAEIDHLCDDLAAIDPDSVAVVFLHSYAYPQHEERVAAQLRARWPEKFITASHELLREYREFERTSTTAANSYIGPQVRGYLGELERGLASRNFAGELLLMQSAGGLYDLQAAKDQCLQLIESGPAGGVVGTTALCRSLRVARAVAFDMGGTTTKACVIEDGKAAIASDYFIGGYQEGLAVRIPTLDIKEIGTGGGSIAWTDEAGGLHVGPRSAGAFPGPACYGNGGTEPTITDADAILGRLAVERLAAQGINVSVDAARVAVQERICEPLGLSLVEAAAGIVQIASADMANAVRAVTVDRGRDPQEFVLIAYGGAGPMHALDVADQVGITRVIVPFAPGVFSAVGMLAADLRRDYVMTRFAPLAGMTREKLRAIYDEIEKPGLSWFSKRGVTEGISALRTVDIRYSGQEHAVTVTVDLSVTDEPAMPGLKSVFDARHHLLYGHSAPEEPAELVTFRVSLTAQRGRPRDHLSDHLHQNSGLVRMGIREIIFDPGADPVDSAVWSHEKLKPGARVLGPAVIDGEDSSCALPSAWAATVGPARELCITRY
jgi:N-methylhydantoinase A